eukprot:scaffold2339_cov180-Alexandrium_tamarense.AAC.11
MPSVEPPVTDGDEHHLSLLIGVTSCTEGALTTEALRRAVDGAVDGAVDVDEGADDVNVAGEVEQMLTDDMKRLPKKERRGPSFLPKRSASTLTKSHLQLPKR